MKTKTKTYPRTSKTVSTLPGESDVLGFFEGVHVAGLTGEWFRLSASEQRRHFGAVIFGKKSIRVDDFGTVTVFWSQAFGRDFDTQTVYWDQSARLWRYRSDDSESPQNFSRI